MPASDYVHDVFVSYTRDHPAGTWVKDRFMKDFRGYLAEALGRRVAIFFDQDEIQPGEIWDEQICAALLHSKVLVAICSAIGSTGAMATATSLLMRTIP
jgi:hypothetical protein